MSKADQMRYDILIGCRSRRACYLRAGGTTGGLPPIHRGAWNARAAEYAGEISKAAADRIVREARIQKRLARARSRLREKANAE